MDTRRYIPPRGVGSPNPCAPFTDQLHLPTLAPQPGTPQAATGLPTDQRKRVHVFNSITTPAAGTTNSLIASYIVPVGHRAKFVGMLVRYEGTGFTEGNASQIYFSLRLDSSSYVQNYDVIPNTLGSLTSGPWPIPAAIILEPGQLIEILVTVPALSGIGTGGTTRCHGHLVGWYEPV